MASFLGDLLNRRPLCDLLGEAEEAVLEIVFSLFIGDGEARLEVASVKCDPAAVWLLSSKGALFLALEGSPKLLSCLSNFSRRAWARSNMRCVKASMSPTGIFARFVFTGTTFLVNSIYRRPAEHGERSGGTHGDPRETLPIQSRAELSR